MEGIGIQFGGRRTRGSAEALCKTSISSNFQTSPFPYLLRMLNQLTRIIKLTWFEEIGTNYSAPFILGSVYLNTLFVFVSTQNYLMIGEKKKNGGIKYPDIIRCRTYRDVTVTWDLLFVRSSCLDRIEFMNSTIML